MKAALLHAIARRAIADKLQVPCLPPRVGPEDDAQLRSPGASFVTLKRHGQLRGCIGTLEAFRPLQEDIAANAVASAFRDPRFPPLNTAEWPELEIEISVLTPPQTVDFVDEEDLFKKITPLQDGVILSQGDNRATFLPQVWEQLPTHQQFFAHLKQKAGLSIDFPVERLHIETYQVTHY